jgi:hypothetical protein
MRVDPDPVAGGAAEQLVDGCVEVLAGDVPQRLVHAGERGHEDRAAPEEGRAVDVLPVVLDAERVLADQVVADLGDRGHPRAGLALERGLAPPHQPVVGRDLDEPRPGAGVELLDFRDLH